MRTASLHPLSGHLGGIAFGGTPCESRSTSNSEWRVIGSVRQVLHSADLADGFARAITFCASAYLVIRIGMGLLSV